MRALPAAWLVALAGCAPALRPALPAPGAPEDAAALAAEVQGLARRIEREPKAAERLALVERAVETAQRCDRAAPASAACDYAVALALGLQARERPSTARDGLALMASRLRRAAAAEPGLDHGGPDRVLALLLLRAPGWPLGPGDPEEGLAAARRAVALAPGHPPNELALAEALLGNDDAEGGRAAARRALALAQAAQAGGDPDAGGWIAAARRLVDAP